jgi:hypothetical protein
MTLVLTGSTGRLYSPQRTSETASDGRKHKEHHLFGWCSLLFYLTTETTKRDSATIANL